MQHHDRTKRTRHGLRRKLLTFAAIGGTVALVGQGAAMAAASASSQPSSPIPTTVLTTDVLPGLSVFTDLGAAPLKQAAQVGITLANPAAAAQNAAYHAIYTKGSPDYHHFMTSAQVAREFGVPAATVSAVKSWATRDGLHAAYTSNTGEYMMLKGNANQVEHTFSVGLHNFSYLGKTFYANTDGPTVPADLDVNGVIGLNSKLAAVTDNHPPATTVSLGAPGISAPGLRPDQTTCEAGICLGLTTPQDLWSIYDQPTDISNPKADFGQGQQMAVLGEGAVSGVIADLRDFEAEHSLPQVPITVHSVGDNFQDTSGSGEWDIDMQASTGMAPEAYGETLFFASDLTDSSVEGDISAWGTDPNGPYQANASFGECEEDPTTPVTGGGAGTSFGGLAGTAGIMFTDASENSLEQATLQAKTLFASTGDTGSSCPVVDAAVIGAGNGVANQGFPETNYPASSPYVTAVGGTVLYSTANTAAAPGSNAKRSIETAWTFTGGGNTFYIPEPDYQDGITALDDQPCLAQPDGTPYSTVTPCRGIPDVSAQSGDVATNGYDVTMAGVNDEAGAGTSLASPLWVGMWTRIQAAAPKLNGKFSLGFANCDLYTIGLDPHFDANDFFDIGNGGVSSPTTADGYYASLPRSVIDPSGWDYVSGLGAPKVTNLGIDLTDNPTFTPKNPLKQPVAVDCGQPGESACVTGGGTSCVASGDEWTEPPHTATDLLGNSDPQLSLTAGAFGTTSGGKTLVVALRVTDLTETVPLGAGAAEWYALWTSGTTTYFANAQLSAVPGSTPTFADGTVTKTGSTSNFNNATDTGDTGKFYTGTNGLIVIDLPVGNVGTPVTGSRLVGPAAETDIEVGSTVSGGLLEKVDTGGPSCDYVVGTGAVNPD